MPQGAHLLSLSGPREPTVDVKWVSERPSDFHFRDTVCIEEFKQGQAGGQGGHLGTAVIHMRAM